MKPWNMLRMAGYRGRLPNKQAWPLLYLTPGGSRDLVEALKLALARWLVKVSNGSVPWRTQGTLVRAISRTRKP